MNSSYQDTYAKIASNAAHCIQASAEHCLPNSEQQQFMSWILNDGNAYQYDYLKMLGVANSIDLEITMLKDLLKNEKNIEPITPYLGKLNAYFAFETIQDNIAMGLAKWFTNKSDLYSTQYRLVKNFNLAIVDKLNGVTDSAVDLLEPYKKLSSNLSAFERCLSPDKMFEFANAYKKNQEHKLSTKKLEHCYHSMLILNIETCVELLESLQGHPLYEYLKKALIYRYSSVNQLLNKSKNYTSKELSEIGAKTILVLPTLIFCIGAIDSINPDPNLEKTITDGSLMQAVHSSAMLVRLLNDLGTNLLTLNEKQRLEIFEHLRQLSHDKQFESVTELLSYAAQSSDLHDLMIRLRKDMEYGEFNICLDNIDDINDIQSSLTIFENNINFYSKLYQEQISSLRNSCQLVESQLANNSISQLIYNMFKFHEKMYSINFKNVYGDYAVLSNEKKSNMKWQSE